MHNRFIVGLTEFSLGALTVNGSTQCRNKAL